MTPTASLPMYNLPEMRAVNARFWQALRGLLAEAGLRDLPPGDGTLRPLEFAAEDAGGVEATKRRS